MLILICLRNSGSSQDSVSLTANDLTLLKKTEKAAAKAGADVVWAESIADISRMSGYDTVVLIAHHSPVADAIEINGQFVSTREVVNAVPTDFGGVLDMTSCYSAGIIQAIKMRCPACSVIGVEMQTSLRLRLIILNYCIDKMKDNESMTYKDALIETLKEITAFDARSTATNRQPGKNAQPNTASSRIAPSMTSAAAAATRQMDGGQQQLAYIPTRLTYLGGETRSTVFAPKKASRGDTFLVQVFIHKDKDKEEVEICARSIDDTAEERNSKPITLELTAGDKIDIGLTVMGKKDEFDIDDDVKQAIWADVPVSVEFAVSVSESCTAKQMLGKIMIAVNKEPAGSFIFKTEIGNDTSCECAAMQSVSYDKKQESDRQCDMMLNKLQNKRNELLSKQGNDTDEPRRQKDLAMINRCIDLLNDGATEQQHQMVRVFISSTSDLKEYRKLVKAQVEQCQMHPEMYENWMQGDTYPRDMCCQKVLESDVFVCILGEKYGCIEPIWDQSMTEIEYRTAVMKGMPILIYVDKNSLPNMEERQKQFATEIMDKRLVSVFDDNLGLCLQSRAELFTVKATLDKKNDNSK